MSVRALAANGRVSERTFRDGCKARGTSAKSCLDCGRCLRVVIMVTVRGAEWDPRGLLSKYYRDPRTLNRLLRMGRLHHDEPPSISEFLQQQRFIRSIELRSEIERALERL